jgi:PIN domain nuclease of toxin-antitoxin system
VARLLDTHIFLAIIEDRVAALPVAIRRILNDPEEQYYLSVASLWEIAIKNRLGKLPLQNRLEELPDIARHYSLTLISIHEHHALADVDPEPPTRDPFDRLLLAQCLVENMKLITIDTALIDHPLSATASRP